MPRILPSGTGMLPPLSEAVSMTTDEFVTFVRSEVKKWAKLVEISGAKVD